MTNSTIRTKRGSWACVCLCFWLSAGCGDSGGIDPFALNGLQGTWRQILLNDEGKRFIKEDEFLEWDSKCTVTDREIIWQSGVRRNVSVLRYSVDRTKTPIWIDWQGDGQSVKGILKLEGDLLSICIGAKRPLDFDPTGSPSENLFVFRRSDGLPVEPVSADSIQLDNAVADFERAALKGDNAALEGTQHQYHGLKSRNKSARYMQLLKHEDPRVRRATVRLFGVPEPAYGKARIDGPVLLKFLEMVGNEEFSVAERSEVVSIVLQDYEDHRELLYAKLLEMDADGQFALPALAAFISDKKHRHWSTGGGFDAPVGAVKLLATWGPQSRAAIPNLIDALEHPNKWKFVPLVAETLGAIGPDAHDAIGALRRLEKSRYSESRKAAAEALERINGDQVECLATSRSPLGKS